MGDASTPRLRTANVGDHALVHALLRAANQAPSYEDFVTWLDEPSYEPSDRLLVQQNGQLVGHAHVLHRTAWFEGVKLPIGSQQDLAVLPECASAGYEPLLLAAAEKAMREAGALLSLVRPPRPEPYRMAGWSDARVSGYSQANVSDVLAQLCDRAASSRRRSRALRIRRWRHVELDAIRLVDVKAAPRQWGALYRGEAYWQWLVGRKAHTDVIVAVDGANDWESLGTRSRIVGYAVTQGARIIELATLPEYARAAPRLLVRACQDAVERDHHTISLHTAASDPLHELLVTAGGTWCADERRAGGTLLVKLLEPARWVEAIQPILRRRAKGGGLPRPLELCFDTGQEHYRLVMTRRSSRLVADEATSSQVRCDRQTFDALLLGNLDVGAACEAKRLDVVDRETLHRVAMLFPPAFFWQSQFDLLRL